MGLPCFCYKADVGEAIRLLGDAPNSLVVYKQPAARKASVESLLPVDSDSSRYCMCDGNDLFFEFNRINDIRSTFGQFFKGLQGSFGISTNSPAVVPPSPVEIGDVLSASCL